MHDAKKFTEGPILGSLLKLTIPVIFANLLQTAYQLTDTFWVGRLGAGAVAAVSISFPIIFLLFSMGGGLAMAGTILVSQFKGKSDHKTTNHVASQTMLMIVLVSLVLSIIGYVISPAIIKLMGAERLIYNDAVSYLQISFIGSMFMFIYFAYQSLMRGVGEVKTPTLIVLGTVLLNLVLDPFFIFGFGTFQGLGVAGAALATIATQGVASIIGIIILLRGKHGVQIKPRELKPDFPLIKKMFALGFPASIEQSTRALGMTVMNFLVTSFGTLTLAAYGIGGRILSFIIIPALGLSMATSSLVGLNIGAGKIDRAEKITRISGIMGFIVLTIVGILVFIFAEPLSELFLPGEPETVAMSTLFIQIMSFSFGLIGIQMVLTGTLRGAGDTFAAMILSIVSLWVLQFPAAYIMSKHTVLAEKGIWIAFPLANVLTTIITVIWYKRGDWKKKKLTDTEHIEEKITEEVMIEEGIQ